MWCSSPLTGADLRASVTAAVGRLDGWLQSMRGPWGYAGPIAHWWEPCLLYCGPMLDWRYEGIIAGYVALYEATGQRRWLDRAVAAAEDVVRRQLPDGSYWNSSFQFGAVEGGTPHEAAVDVGLLLLARVLRREGDPTAERYLHAAERNLVEYHLGRLWNGAWFLDQSWNETAVANKNATTIEALLLLEALTGRDLSTFLRGAAHLLLKAQVHEPGPRHGGTVHLGTGPDALVISFYTARCVSALAQLCERFHDERYDRALSDAVDFLARQVEPAGLVFGYYRDGRRIANPRWISPAAEVLRAFRSASRYRPVPHEVVDRLVRLLLQAQLPSGGIPTGWGSARRGFTGSPPEAPEFRDVLPVVGWCDKAFRALASLVDGPVDPRPPASTTVACTWKAWRCRYREEEDCLWLERQHDGRLLFRWWKGSVFPDVFDL